MPVWNNLGRALRLRHTSRGARLMGLGVLCIASVLSLAPPDANAEKGKTLSGKLTYDRVPSTPENGLDYSATVQKPIRNVRVVLIEDKGKETNTGKELASTVSADDGSYSFAIPDAVTRVRVRAFAETITPPLLVQDNTNDKAIYVMESAAIITTTAVTTKNLNAGSGWGGSSYTGVRAAGPFACLDTLYTAARSFVAVRPLANFPLLEINWSINNRPEDGDVALGQIGTSNYSGGLGGIFILGKEDVDTDEYDAHVMVHEWGHYFEDKVGRSDSIGGTHGSGDIIDPRVAFGEGWGNALSAMILFPDATYKDTGGVGQASTTLLLDLDANGADDPTPGWFSEASVQSVIFDLFDPANESFDGVALGLGPIYDVMTGGQKTTPAVTTIFSFIQAVKSLPGMSPATRAAIDTLTAKSRIGPVNDAFGTGETNNAGNVANLPVYRQLTLNGDSQTLTFLGNVNNANRLGANRLIRFTSPDGGPTQVYATSPQDISITLLEDGKVIARADDTINQTEQLSFIAKAGKTYVIAIQGLVIGSSGQYTATVNIESGSASARTAVANRKTAKAR